MDTIADQTIRILNSTDEQIRQLIVVAANAGDLAGVDIARDVAGRVRDIVHSLEPRDTEPRTGQFHSIGSAPAGRTARTHARKASRYPQYFIRNEALHRLGWSKKEKSEYAHKAPKSVFDKTVSALAELAKASSGPIAADRIIQEINRSSASPIPSYQIYVVIGLLRERECLEQVGREGYLPPQDIHTRASNTWKNLSSKNADIGG